MQLEDWRRRGGENVDEEDEEKYSTLKNALVISKLEEYASSNIDNNIYLGVNLKLNKSLCAVESF